MRGLLLAFVLKKGEYMIELKNVSKTFDINKKEKIKVVALDGIDLSFDEKGLIATVGKSGSGKTTLLNILGGIDKQSKGSIIYNGINMDSFKESDFDLYRNNDISLIFQEYNLLNDYTVIENIKIACRLQGKNKSDVGKKAEEALRLVRLDELADRKINSLSGGQQQRVAIARAIAKDSKIVLCDEPTGNLDSKTSSEIFELLKEIARERLVIVVTHDKDFADQYADRLIVLSDGKIIEDKLFAAATAVLEPKVLQLSKNYGGISIRDTLKMIGDNLKKSIIGNLFVMLLLIATIALTTIFSSLARYDQQDALVNTLKQNNQGLIQITKYIDYPREEYDAVNKVYYTKNGPVLFYEKEFIDDLEYLTRLTEGKADFYKSYFFNKNLQDFTNNYIYTDRTSFSYEARCFREAVSIPDFSKFNMRIKFGSIPKETNDILIYDYMANSLLYYGVCAGEIADVVGQTLVDTDTGLVLRIAGIVASDYELYSYLKNDNNKHDFEETYLTSLQIIFCTPDSIYSLVEEQEYSSVYKTYFIDQTGAIVADTNIKKLKYLGLNDIDFISTIDNYIEERGVVVDKQTVAQIMNVDITSIDENVATEFLGTYSATGIKDYFDFSFERNYLSGFAYKVIGVVDNDLNDNILYWYTPNADDLYMSNATFRQFYLSLGPDWDVNKQVLSKFIYQTHNNEFYAANPDYYFESYTDYTSYGLLIRDADYYLIKVKDFAQTIMIILICVTALGLFFYATLTIKKYSYKIGVLKALGAKNGDILSIFGVQVLLITLLAFLLSIPVSYGVMASINSTFIGDINPNLVFFAIKPLAIGLMFVFTLMAVLISICLPLIRLYMQTPMMVIRGNNKK